MARAKEEESEMHVGAALDVHESVLIQSKSTIVKDPAIIIDYILKETHLRTGGTNAGYPA